MMMQSIAPFLLGPRFLHLNRDSLICTWFLMYTFCRRHNISWDTYSTRRNVAKKTLIRFDFQGNIDSCYSKRPFIRYHYYYYEITEQSIKKISMQLVALVLDMASFFWGVHLRTFLSRSVPFQFMITEGFYLFTFLQVRKTADSLLMHCLLSMTCSPLKTHLSLCCISQYFC